MDVCVSITKQFWMIDYIEVALLAMPRNDFKLLKFMTEQNTYQTDDKTTL